MSKMWKQINNWIRKSLGKPTFRVLYLNMTACQQKFNQHGFNFAELQDGLFFLLDIDRQQAMRFDTNDAILPFPTKPSRTLAYFRRKFRESLYWAEKGVFPRAIWPTAKTADQLRTEVNQLLRLHYYQPIPEYDPSSDPPFLNKWLAKSIQKHNPELTVIF